MGETEPTLKDVRKLMFEGYVPFAEIDRAINWPFNNERLENDAEHTFSLALVAGSIASELNLDAQKTVSFAVVHDLVEIYAGDTSVWDELGTATKEQRELESLDKLKQEFNMFPWITETIEDYESLESEESCLVYALDKLMATLMIVRNNGHYWKLNNITFEQHMNKYREVRIKVAKHPLILKWYDETILAIEADKEKYFES